MVKTELQIRVVEIHFDSFVKPSLGIGASQ